MSTLTITLSRTALSLSPLVLSGADDANPIGITGYQEPARQARIRYAPDSDYVPGSIALASTLQQTLLNFNIVTDQAASETASRAAIAEVAAALSQFTFTATVVVDGAPAEVWTCNPGSMAGPARDSMNLRDHNPVWAVSIPCYPIPGA